MFLERTVNSTIIITLPLAQWCTALLCATSSSTMRCLWLSMSPGPTTSIYTHIRIYARSFSCGMAKAGGRGGGGRGNQQVTLKFGKHNALSGNATLGARGPAPVASTGEKTTIHTCQTRNSSHAKANLMVRAIITSSKTCK